MGAWGQPERGRAGLWGPAGAQELISSPGAAGVQPTGSSWSSDSSSAAAGQSVLTSLSRHDPLSSHPVKTTVEPTCTCRAGLRTMQIALEGRSLPSALWQFDFALNLPWGMWGLSPLFLGPGTLRQSRFELVPKSPEQERKSAHFSQL